MSWFKNLFHDVEADVEKLADHIEAEFKALEARVVAVEKTGIVTPTPVATPIPATEPPPAV